MEILRNNKGGIKIVFDGYLYTRHSTKTNKIWWKCVKKSSCQCRGMLKTDLERNHPEVGLPHNHAPDHSAVRLAKVQSDMKHIAATTRATPAQIFAEAVSSCEDDVRALLPSADSCKRTIRNQRPAPPAPRCLEDLGELPDEFTVTVDADHEGFVIGDNGPNRTDRALVFATESGLRLLASTETVYMDGNFAMAPSIFKQIYVFRVQLGHCPVTVVYALLPAKTRATYEFLFQTVVDKCTELGLEMNVKTVVTDFEDAVLRAAVAVFGRDISCKGCFFHLCQSTWRKIQELGLTHQYHAEEEFRLFCGMIDGLAFLPLADVTEGMQFLRDNVPQDPPEAEDLLNYFDRTYVSGYYHAVRQQPAEDNEAAPLLRMRRVPPLFPPEVWNVNSATIDNNPRTNNICEGWNNKFRNLVGHYHPSIWRTIEWFQKEAATVHTIMQQDAVGNQPGKRLPLRFIRMQQRLRNLCIARRDGRKTVPEMLRGVGWNVRQNRQT